MSFKLALTSSLKALAAAVAITLTVVGVARAEAHATAGGICFDTAHELAQFWIVNGPQFAQLPLFYVGVCGYTRAQDDAVKANPSAY